MAGGHCTCWQENSDKHKTSPTSGYGKPLTLHEGTKNTTKRKKVRNISVVKKMTKCALYSKQHLTTFLPPFLAQLVPSKLIPSPVCLTCPSAVDRISGSSYLQTNRSPQSNYWHTILLSYTSTQKLHFQEQKSPKYGLQHNFPELISKHISTFMK